MNAKTVCLSLLLGWIAGCKPTDLSERSNDPKPKGNFAVKAVGGHWPDSSPKLVLTFSDGKHATKIWRDLPYGSGGVVTNAEAAVFIGILHGDAASDCRAVIVAFGNGDRYAIRSSQPLRANVGDKTFLKEDPLHIEDKHGHIIILWDQQNETRRQKFVTTTNALEEIARLTDRRMTNAVFRDAANGVVYMID